MLSSVVWYILNGSRQFLQTSKHLFRLVVQPASVTMLAASAIASAMNFKYSCGCCCACIVQ
jgi:hypothetical protein